jgi:cytochrome P450
MNPFFSRRAIVNKEDVIKGKIQKLLQRLRSAEGTGRVIRLDHAYHALTTDVISQYAYGYCDGYIDDPDFKPEWARVTLSWLENGALTRQFPWIVQILRSCFSVKLLEPLSPGLGLGTCWQDNLQALAKEIVRKSGSRLFSRSPKRKTPSDQKTIFHEILESDLPASQKSPLRIAAEGTVLLSAACNTIPHTLTTITFHLLQDPHIMSTLKKELDNYFPDRDCDFTWTELERVPYLVCISLFPTSVILTTQ